MNCFSERNVERYPSETIKKKYITNNIKVKIIQKITILKTKLCIIMWSLLINAPECDKPGKKQKVY